jgi:hypothetical protein
VNKMSLCTILKRVHPVITKQSFFDMFAKQLIIDHMAPSEFQRLNLTPENYDTQASGKFQWGTYEKYLGCQTSIINGVDRFVKHNPRIQTDPNANYLYADILQRMHWSTHYSNGFTGIYISNLINHYDLTPEEFFIILTEDWKPADSNELTKPLTLEQTQTLIQAKNILEWVKEVLPLDSNKRILQEASNTMTIKQAEYISKQNKPIGWNSISPDEIKISVATHILNMAKQILKDNGTTIEQSKKILMDHDYGFDYYRGQRIKNSFRWHTNWNHSLNLRKPDGDILSDLSFYFTGKILSGSRNHLGVWQDKVDAPMIFRR